MHCITSFSATLEPGSYPPDCVLGRNVAGRLCMVTVAAAPLDVVACIGEEGREVGDPYGEVHVGVVALPVTGDAITEADLASGVFWFVENEAEPCEPFVQMSALEPSGAVLQVPDRMRPFAVGNDGRVLLYVRPVGL